MTEGLGRRAQRRRQRREQRRRLLAGALAVAVAVLAVVTVVLIRRHDVPPRTVAAQARTQQTVLLQVRGPVMAQQSWAEATMKVGVWQKDMKLIHAALAATHTPAPLFAATEPIYNATMAAGHAEHDTAAVYDVLRRMCAETR